MAYYLGYGPPVQDWRRESAETGAVARYTRDGRPWRLFYDRDLDRRWDMWIDERAGPPYIVSIDDTRDGNPDRHEDEFGNPLSGWHLSELRAEKTFSEFLASARQLQYTAIALMIYTLLEFAVRSATREK
jgi:hypothetical protein